MTFSHTPVLLDEVLTWLAPSPGQILVDGTLGGGGHSEAILQSLGGQGHLYGIDRDDAAIEAASKRLAGYANFTPLRGNFHDAQALLAAQGITTIDGMLLDLGVSSHQLDTAARGFSYHADAPLDMRMDRGQPLTAADLLNTLDEAELTRILLSDGEEKWAARIAKIIVEHRAQKPFATTGDLVHAVDAAIPRRIREKDDGHPARRTFQALRIAVNDELAPLEQALEDAMHMLTPGGRLVVITFHSLEDRIAKRTFKRFENPCTCPPRMPVCVCGKKPIGRVLARGAVKPTEAEIAENPRARSAKLRVVEKLPNGGM